MYALVLVGFLFGINRVRFTVILLLGAKVGDDLAKPIYVYMNRYVCVRALCLVVVWSGWSWGKIESSECPGLGLACLISSISCHLCSEQFYAITFYHVMEYTSDTPPPDPLPYWATEGPFLLSLALLSYRVLSGPTLFKKPSRAKGASRSSSKGSKGKTQ